MSKRGGWITLPNGNRAIRFGHETEAEAVARYARIEAHRDSLIEPQDPAVERAYKAGLAAAQRADETHTVWANGRAHVLPARMVEALLKRVHPRYVQPGTMGAEMRAQADARQACAALLGIPLAQVSGIVGQLKRNRQAAYIERMSR
ncbi:hypothetical protein ACF1A5_11380 [Streptomyces sp. NPDC014864]|uniref:hypothetical protein n=1 Tax=Streptomyces sp. NPDC014864 TaxID=3364924 RepID=UPI0036F5DB71